MSKVMVRDRKNETGMTSLVLIYRCNSSSRGGAIHTLIFLIATNRFQMHCIAFLCPLAPTLRTSRMASENSCNTRLRVLDHISANRL